MEVVSLEAKAKKCQGKWFRSKRKRKLVKGNAFARSERGNLLKEMLSIEAKA